MMFPESTHIVVVNDNPEFLELMADVLRDGRFPNTIVDGDREDAVEAIKAAKPQLLIIDLRLGKDELHGWEVIQQVRSDAELSVLPTLICTGDREALTLLEDDLAGMRRVATLLKPFSIEELMTQLQALLAREPA
jgi:CheY-like chemotaxis protein